VYEKRELVSSTIKLSDIEGNFPGGNFSVAITDDKDIDVDSSVTIMSSLLLSSELKGYIETPAYYLQDNKKANFALDLLMMTHGWRRYNIPEVIKGNMEYPLMPEEISKEISGTVKSGFFGKSAEKAEVSIMTSYGYMDIVETNEKGEFLFTGIDPSDSTSVYIQALNKKGKSDFVEITVNREQFPGLVKIPYGSVVAIDKIDTKEEDDVFLQKAEQRAKFDDDMRFVQLDEVKVSAKRIDRKDEARLKFWANLTSDVTITRDKIDKYKYITVEDILRQNIPGVWFGTDEERNRKVYNVAGRGDDALLILDGVIIEDLALIYDAVDVESVDVFKWESAALFGSRGGNGAVSITTRSGAGGELADDKNRTDLAVMSPLGYRKPVEFYSPKYDTPNSKYLNNPDYRSTVFWKPDVVVTGNEEASFSFYTADLASTYSVVIEGVSSDGSLVRHVEKIEVRNR
jgi:hypothetical protein